MKRGGPIKRNTPLNRGSSQLKSTTPMKRSGKLRPRSKKTEKRYREERVPLVKRLLEERPWCQACKLFAELDGVTFYRVNPSVDLHEILSRGRTGGVHSEEWLDEDNILCVCRPCHNRITDDKPDEDGVGEATKLGLLKGHEA